MPNIDFSKNEKRLICPFCGGEMIWNNDFMQSELGCCSDLKYVKINDERTLQELKENYGKLYERGVVFKVNDVSSVNKEVEQSNDYQYIYIECDGDFYEINDVTVSVYECERCGKTYEITDCYPSEKENYLYYKYNNEQDNTVL